MPLHLLVNSTSEDFIAGDQPVINTHATELSGNKTPSNLEFYYPVSPKLAIMISDSSSNSDKETRRELTLKEVEHYNTSIYKQSHSQIYASNKEILVKYVV